MRKKPDTAILGFLVASSLDGEQSSAKNPLEGAMVASCVWDFCSSHNAIDLKIIECLARSAFLKRAAVRVS